jgi:acetolactate synthase-1/3 small subunit
MQRLTDIFRGRVIDVTDSTYTVELTGTSEKLDGFINAAHTDNILEVVRSGVTGIARGQKALRV